jgi:hypothetical protein
MSEDKKVDCIMLNTDGGDGKSVIWQLRIGEAILEIKRGEATCNIPLEELEKLEHSHLFGELELIEKVKALEEKVDSLQADLSFLTIHKPKIDIVMNVCHRIKAFWLKSWSIIVCISVIATLVGFGMQCNWWGMFKQAPPASALNQTKQGLQGSGVPGGYTGNKTHLHSPVNIQQKHGDRSPLYRVSK